MRWFAFFAFGALVAAGTSAAAASSCDGLLGLLGHQIADTSCIDSPDLTTNNPLTTPANNSLPGLPPFAFTPQTDRAVISPTAHTPITKTVPGVQLDGRVAHDPTGEARVLLRLPTQWNGKLVVGPVLLVVIERGKDRENPDPSGLVPRSSTSRGERGFD